MAQGAAKKVKKRKPSVLKRIRQAQRRSIVNRANRTRVRTAIKRMDAALAAKDSAAAGNLLRPTMSEIDHAIRKGVLPENTGNRYKSRLTRATNALRAAK